MWLFCWHLKNCFDCIKIMIVILLQHWYIDILTTKDSFIVVKFRYIGCSFKFLLKVGIEESIVKAPRITHHGSANLTSLFALFLFLICRLTSGAFTIDLTQTLRRNLSEQPILVSCIFNTILARFLAIWHDWLVYQFFNHTHFSFWKFLIRFWASLWWFDMWP
jgi:hypothetical protein